MAVAVTTIAKQWLLNRSDEKFLVLIPEQLKILPFGDVERPLKAGPVKARNV